jgi:hypothetical protein
VAAHIVKRPYLEALVAHENQALAGDFSDHKISAPCNLVTPPRMEPHVEEEPLELGSIVIGVCVVSSRQAHLGVRLIAHRKFLVLVIPQGSIDNEPMRPRFACERLTFFIEAKGLRFY